jgi:hypothetical protein
MPSLIAPSRTSPPASGELFDLVIGLNWDAVAKHAQEHPQDAAWFDGEWLETPLYCACQHDPSEKAIRAILKGYPPAATLAKKNGDLPLHIACYSGASMGVLRAVLEHEPSTVCATTKYGKTPIMALWDGYKPPVTPTSRQDGYPAMCEKSTLLLEAVAQTYGMVALDTGDPLCLHAAMKMECSDSLLYFILDKYKHQISQSDGQGRLPLHLAAAPGIPNRRRLWRCVFESLLAEYPEAARTPDPVTGRLALHTMAYNSAYTWDELEVVFQAAPRTISERDPVTGLPPFALAATNKSSSVEVSFCLLAAQPDVLRDTTKVNVSICREESNSARKWPLVASAIKVGFFAVVAGYAFAAAIR